jgi:hypothetical protein
MSIIFSRRFETKTLGGRWRHTEVRALSSIMVGLDPTIHLPNTPVDPRVEPEDDLVGGHALQSKKTDNKKGGTLRHRLSSFQRA